MTGRERGMRRGGGLPTALIAALCAALPTGAERAAAQEMDVIPPPAATAVGGLFDRDDFGGDGASAVAGFRVRFPLGGHVLLEPGLSYTTFRPDTVGRPEASADDLELLFLDFQLQLQLPVRRFRPYVGIGAGGAVDFRADRGPEPFLISSLSAALGVAVDLGPRFTALGEGRMRTLDDIDRRALEIVLGIGWRP